MPGAQGSLRSRPSSALTLRGPCSPASCALGRHAKPCSRATKAGCLPTLKSHWAPWGWGEDSKSVGHPGDT